MKLLIHLIRPKYFIPIHGELRQLNRHADLAQEVGIPAREYPRHRKRTGDRIRRWRNAPDQRARSAQYVFVDGSGVGDVDPDVMREREALSRDWHLMVNLTMSNDFNAVVYEPEIITNGFAPAGSGRTAGRKRKKAIQAASRANGNVRREWKKPCANSSTAKPCVSAPWFGQQVSTSRRWVNARLFPPNLVRLRLRPAAARMRRGRCHVPGVAVAASNTPDPVPDSRPR